MYIELRYFCFSDGRLVEGDQILAIDGQPLDSNISHEQAISILQKARGLVELVVARSTQGNCHNLANSFIAGNCSSSSEFFFTNLQKHSICKEDDFVSDNNIMIVAQKFKCSGSIFIAGYSNYSYINIIIYDINYRFFKFIYFFFSFGHFVPCNFLIFVKTMSCMQ